MAGGQGGNFAPEEGARSAHKLGVRDAGARPTERAGKTRAPLGRTGNPPDGRATDGATAEKNRGRSPHTALPVGRDGAPERGRRSATSATPRSGGQGEMMKRATVLQTPVRHRTTAKQGYEAGGSPRQTPPTKPLSGGRQPAPRPDGAKREPPRARGGGEGGRAGRFIGERCVGDAAGEAKPSLPRARAEEQGGG